MKSYFQSVKFHLVLALVFSIVAILWQAEDYTFENYTGDTQGYIHVAYDLAEKGIFTDGHYAAQAIVTGPNGEGMFFAPLYPAMLAGILKVDPVFHNMVQCYVEKQETSERKNCPQDFGLLKTIQIILAMTGLFAVWLAAWVVTRRMSVAWLALALSSLAEAYAYYAGFIMTEALVFPLFTGACLLGVLAWKFKKARLFFAYGVALGVLALARPSYAYLFYAAFLVIALLVAFFRKQLSNGSLRWPLLFAFGYILAVGPWIVRNGILLGDYAISGGYASFILSQRVAFNDMNWKEWRASFVYGLPDFGDSLVEDFFKPEDYKRLDYGNPQGYYMVRNQALWDAVKDGKKLPKDRLSEIIKKDVLGNFYKHVMITFSLVWRGMWVSKYWGLVTIPIFIALFIYAVRKKWMEFLIFSIPPWFMLGFNAFTSVNVVRYNLVLIPCLALAAAFFIVSGVDRLRHRRKIENIT